MKNNHSVSTEITNNYVKSWIMFFIFWVIHSVVVIAVLLIYGFIVFVIVMACAAPVYYLLLKSAMTRSGPCPYCGKELRGIPKDTLLKCSNCNSRIVVIDSQFVQGNDLNLEDVKQTREEFAPTKWQRIGAILIYIFVFVIPAYYLFTTEIPPRETLHKTEGELFFRPLEGKGCLTVLKTPDGEVLFTCADTVLADNSCLLGKTLKLSLQGKNATVYWYRQPVYFFYERSRLVELWVSNDPLVNYSKTKQCFENETNSMWWLLLVMPIGFLCIDIFYVRLSKRRKIKDE